MQKHNRELLNFFLAAGLAIALMFGLTLIRSFFTPKAYGSENYVHGAAKHNTGKAEFQKLEFASKYNNVTVKAPFTIEIDYGTRNLTFGVNDSDAKFKFLAEITPRDYSWLRMLLMKTTKESVLIANSVPGKPGHFITGANDSTTAGDVTINVESDRSSWLDTYKKVIIESFASCRVVKGNFGKYARCKPLVFEVRILRLERDKNSLSLPPNYTFPNVDYVDIYVEILNIKEVR